jgi:hypothetical protein
LRNLARATSRLPGAAEGYGARLGHGAPEDQAHGVLRSIEGCRSHA